MKPAYADAKAGFFVAALFSHGSSHGNLETRTKLEGGEACIATASGMAAIMSVVMSTLQAGDHLVSSRALFGSTLGMFSQIFSKFGITRMRCSSSITASAARRCSSR
ncbi:O-acetylhomoserine/O-acetylserine sulfhydrylase-like pyridoxal-dependent enzyme [Paraburkholderia sp. CI3]